MSIHLQIPEPCHENWQNMQPNKDGRHCMACQKTVVDFSNMTDKEILDYISNAGGDICGSVDRLQLNRGLRENKVRKRFSWIYIWNMVIVLFVFAGKTKAQGGVKYQKIAKCTERQPGLTMPKPRAVNGIVQNAMTGEPVPFASVMLKGTEIGVSTDSTGKFLLEMPVLQAGTELEISSLGFETAIISVSNPAEQIYNLSPAAKELDQVVVTTSVCYKQVLSGAMSSVRVSTVYEKFSRELGELLPKKNVIIYPNPIAAGNNIQAALQLKEKGEYRVDLVNAGGRIVWMRKVNINDAKYNLSIPTQHSWSAGIYWLRISGNHTKKIYNGKIVMQ